jgi:hypothetical protein
VNSRFVFDFVNKARVFNTFRDRDVTYQIMAYRELKGEEARKKVLYFLKKASPKKRPKPGDVVIVDTAIGLRSN